MRRAKAGSREIEALYSAILSLKTADECAAFFDDVATIGEVNAMAQRLEVARLLKGGMKYADVAEQTGASSATISRVSRCLGYGAGGYVRVLERMEEE